MNPKLLIALPLVLTCLRAVSQVQPSAAQSGVQGLSAGLGVSNFNPDFGRGRMYGGTLWVDYALNRLPAFLNGTGLEVEGRDISLGQPATEAITREDSLGGGPTYTLSRYENFRPYAKLILGVENVDYLGSKDKRFNQSRTLTSFGGGFDCHAYRAAWVRVDYAYEYLPDFFSSKTGKSAPLDPQGFTVGAMYHFSGRSGHR